MLGPYVVSPCDVAEESWRVFSPIPVFHFGALGVRESESNVKGMRTLCLTLWSSSATKLKLPRLARQGSSRWLPRQRGRARGPSK